DPEEDLVDYPADGGDDGDDEEGSTEDDEDDDMDIEVDKEEEEHPVPADSVVVASTAADQAPSAEETKPFETDEFAATPPPHPAYRMTARISIPALKLGIALGPGYEIGEIASAAAARPAGGLRAAYGFVATMDREIMRDPERGWLWDHRLVGRDSEDFTGSTNASDLVRREVMSLRTTLLGQMTEIRELHAADRRRQIVILELLRADHRRSTEGQQGLAGGPTQPELPEEAGSGS
nr:hypothetical protein [Tanacetum cinerariifolium]